MTGTGRDHTFHEIRPVRTLRTPAFRLKEVRRHADLAEHDRLPLRADARTVPREGRTLLGQLIKTISRTLK